MTTPPPAPASPTSAAAVAEHVSLPPGPESEAKVTLQVAAVNEMVPRIATTGPASQAVGALMLAGRLYRRRQSLDGVATFTAEGAAYVQRNDPDIAMLLGIGSWAPPVVG